MVQAADAYLNTRLTLLAGWISHPKLPEKLIHGDNSQLEDLLLQANLTPEFSSLVSQPTAFDKALHRHLLDEVSTLLRATSGALRELIIHWLRQYEVMNIKTILRARAYGEPLDSTQIELVDIGKYSSLAVETLLASEDVNEILRLLERYGYASLAQKARRNYEDRQNVFDLEAMIDRQYYAELVQRMRFLKREQQKLLQPLLGMMLDRINLIWLIRYRLNYGMEVSHIYYLLAPTGIWLDKSILMNLVQQSTLSDMQEQLPRIWKTALSDYTDVEQIEIASDQLLFHYYSDLFRESTSSIVRLFCYLWLRQFQLRQIAIIIKGRQLGLDVKVIASAAGIETEIESEFSVSEDLTRVRAG